MYQYNLCQIECDGTSIGGVQSVWVAPRAVFSPWWFYTETHNLQYAKIAYSRATTRVCMCNILENTLDAKFTQTQAIVPSRNYTMSLELHFNAMSMLNRDLLEQFVVDGSLVVVFLDWNDRFWLMGETHGCSAAWTSQTDAFKGKNEHVLTFSCVERYPIRAIDDEYITYYLTCEGFRLSSYASMSDIPCETSWTDICSSPKCAW